MELGFFQVRGSGMLWVLFCLFACLVWRIGFVAFSLPDLHRQSGLSMGGSGVKPLPLRGRSDVSFMIANALNCGGVIGGVAPS